MTRTSSPTDITHFEVIGHAPTVQQFLTGAYLYDEHGYRMKLLHPYSTAPKDTSDTEQLVHVPVQVELGHWEGGQFVVDYTLQKHHASGLYAGAGSVLQM